MKRIPLLSRICLLTMSCIAVAHAQEGQDAFVPSMGDSYGDAFVNYLPYTTKPKTPPAQPAAPAPSKPAPAESKKPGKQRVTAEWLRENYPKLQERSIDNPTQENVSAELYARRIIFDKSQRYSDMVTKVTNQDPLINENNRIPYASTGATAVKNANYLAQQQAVRELSQFGGLLVFVDGHCRFCAKELPLIDILKKTYGMEYLVISTDGTAPKDFKGVVKPDNGLFEKLGLKLTPSIVYVPRPKGYANAVDHNQYLVISQGFYALDEMVKQIAFAGHETQLLSKDTMRDLNVWDRGVAANADLQNIELDVDQPGTFKETLQPILLKQYNE